ncbi:MAG: FIST signal transduction protein [Gammaproteobacteria bacterium]
MNASSPHHSDYGNVDTHLLSDTTNKALQKQINKMQAAGKKSILILSCAANAYNADDMSEYLQSLSVQVFGGLFPSIVYENNKYDTGTVLIGYDFEMPVAIFENPSPDGLYDNMEECRTRLNDSSNLMILIDGLSGHVEIFIEKLYQELGSGLQVIGGGAGSLDFVHRPCLFSNRGMLQDAALVISLSNGMRSAAGHGWEILDGPYLVTEADGHKIISLNFQPAFELYRDVVERISDHRFTTDNFFDVSKYFPFGISEMGTDLLVRDPIVCDGKTITCVGELPTNATVYILKGEANYLIDSAKQAAQEALTMLEHESSAPNTTTIIFDCISRLLYLDTRFPEELHGINGFMPAQASLVGALSLGEIANEDGGPIQLLNKSFVIGSY